MRDHEQQCGCGMTGVNHVDNLAVTVVTDNYFDKLRPDQKVARRPKTGHGNSLLKNGSPGALIQEIPKKERLFRV